MSEKDVALRTADTYQYTNSTVFYSLVNANFLPYYQTVVRKSQQWLDGYDPLFHKQDVVSTRLTAKLMNGFTNSIFGRGLVFEKGKGNIDEKNKALNFISHEWAEKSCFGLEVKRLIGFTLPMGTGALKVNKSISGDLWVESIRMDNFTFVGSKRKLNKFTTFIRAFNSVDNKEENYFLVEKRYFTTVKEKTIEKINGKKFEFPIDKRVPCVCYSVYKTNGSVQQNTMPSSIKDSSSINFKSLPTWVKATLKEEYSAIILDKEIYLPFNDWLGVELFYNEGVDITNPTLPTGRALVFDCLADLMEYDLEKTFSIRDLYNSKGIVGVPKNLTQSDLAVEGTGGHLHHVDSAFSQLQISGYEVVNGLDPNIQKPIITQFEIRAAEHETKQMALLKSIAISVGVSPRSIASFLVQAGEKTDDQIQSEDDTITQWIKTHRQDYVPTLNKILEHILNYYGYKDNVVVRFANEGLIKGDKQLENIQKRMELGLLDIEDAVREIYPDLDEEQLKIKINKAKNAQKQQQEQSMNEFDEMFGDKLNENESNEF